MQRLLGALDPLHYSRVVAVGQLFADLDREAAAELLDHRLQLGDIEVAPEDGGDRGVNQLFDDQLVRAFVDRLQLELALQRRADVIQIADARRGLLFARRHRPSHRVGQQRFVTGNCGPHGDARALAHVGAAPREACYFGDDLLHVGGALHRAAGRF